MQKQFMQIEDPQERLQALKDNCEKQETGFYTVELSPEDIQVRRERLERVSIDLSAKAKEKKEWMDAWKLEVKPMESERDIIVQQLKNKKIDAEGDLYLFANHAEGVMEYYNTDGIMVYERKLRPEEKQMRMQISGGRKAVNE